MNEPKPNIEYINTIKGQLAVNLKLNHVINTCHGIADECGWWADPEKRNVPTLLMLCVSELAEAMEGHRKGLQDSHLPDYDSLTVELADAVIRIFDMAGGLELDLAGAMTEKLYYNTNRADHKLANREEAGGKKY